MNDEDKAMFITGSLRDYFAAAALQGMLASEDADSSYGEEAAARRAYKMADAMLAEREKKP